MKAYASLRQVNLELKLGMFSEGTLPRNADLSRHKYVFSRVKSTSCALVRSDRFGGSMRRQLSLDSALQRSFSTPDPFAFLTARSSRCPSCTKAPSYLASSFPLTSGQERKFRQASMCSKERRLEVRDWRKREELWGRECLALRDRAGLA